MTNELKEEVIDLIKNLSDDVTLEDIQYHLFIKQKLQISNTQIQEGKISSHEKVMERVKKKWFK
ncbi:MAG: hypothetical protein BAJALOKI1v1_2420010 [Promethearchaeota archaeon]|nr:MAG: hypothetical protein BAJALOKI1v1_2420010 [Candidatus Lokiarchaeota archaeon]